MREGVGERRLAALPLPRLHHCCTATAPPPLFTYPPTTLARPPGRKNKTLGAIFRQSNTLALLEQNYEVYQVGSNASVGGR